MIALAALHRMTEPSAGLFVSPWFYAGAAACVGVWYYVINLGMWLFLP